MANDDNNVPEFRVPGTTSDQERPVPPKVEAAPTAASDSPPKTVAELPPLGPRCEGSDYDAARIDIRMSSLKARRGSRRLRRALDAAKAVKSNNRRVDPNSPRDSIEWLFEWIDDLPPEGLQDVA